jgi:hypothetical protein
LQVFLPALPAHFFEQHSELEVQLVVAGLHVAAQADVSWLQAPVSALHESTLHDWLSLQFLGVKVHAPVLGLQAPTSQRFDELHVTAVWLHEPRLQVSVVHPLPSSQSTLEAQGKITIGSWAPDG